MFLELLGRQLIMNFVHLITRTNLICFMKTFLLLLGVLLSFVSYSQKATQNESYTLDHLLKLDQNQLRQQSVVNQSSSQAVDWYDYGLLIYSNSNDRSLIKYAVFPDTTVKEDLEYRPFYHMYGQVFHPSGNFFEQAYGGSYGEINENYTYTLDSLKLYYNYTRPQTANPDTLELQFFTLDQMYSGSYGNEVYATPYYDKDNNTCLSPILTQKILLNNSHVNTDVNTQLEIKVNGLPSMPGDQPIAVVVNYKPGNTYSDNDSLDYAGVDNPINSFGFYRLRDNTTLHDNSYNHMLYANNAQRYGTETGLFEDKLRTGIDFTNYYYQGMIAFGITKQASPEVIPILSADSICIGDDVSMYLVDSINFTEYNWLVSGPEVFDSEESHPTFTFSELGAYSIYVSGKRGGTRLDTLMTEIVVVEEIPTVSFPVDTVTISVNDTADYVLPTPSVIPWSTLDGFITDTYVTFEGAVKGSNTPIGEYEITYAALNGNCITLETIVLNVQASLLSIDEELNNISIYPNPVENELYFEGFEANQIENIEIYSATGLKVESIQRLSNGNINVSELAKGVYFIQLIKDGHIVNKQFIKN